MAVKITTLKELVKAAEDRRAILVKGTDWRPIPARAVLEMKAKNIVKFLEKGITIYEPKDITIEVLQEQYNERYVLIRLKGRHFHISTECSFVQNPPEIPEYEQESLRSIKDVYTIFYLTKERVSYYGEPFLPCPECVVLRRK